MLVLTIRSDNPTAEIGLFDSGRQLAYETWQAHRELAETIHLKIQALLEQAGKQLQDVEGIVAFQGPGSFTGLRIGLTVANTLAYGLEVPIAAAKSEDWVRQGIERLQAGKADELALPEYGAPVHITQQKK